MPTALHPLLGLVAALFLGLAWLYSSFTAEDAYIVYRYAENWVAGRGLVFNAGEPINALTSPLHAAACAALHALGARTVAASKVAGVLAVGLACALVLRTRRLPPPPQLLFAGLVLLSPFVALWAVGGLETPFLLLAVTGSLLLAERCVAPGGAARRLAFSALLGLAFLIRFDSVVFTLPLFASVAWAEWRRGPHRRVAALATLTLPGLALALGWLAISRLYYHDLLPTSFYHKRPGLENAAVNAVYLAQFVLFSGLLPLAAGVAWLRRRRPRDAPGVSPASVGAALGLAGVAAYGLTAATTHMMFAYRLFVPYLPVAVLLLLGRLPRSARGAAWGRAWGSMLAAVLALQLGLAAWVELGSLNPGLRFEYSRVSRREYLDFLDALARQADAIRRHWARHGGPLPPRVFVYAAGVVPYRLSEAQVLDGGLLSYRHAYDGNGVVPPLPTSADYVLTLHPYLGAESRQLEEQPERFEPIFELARRFDGAEQRFAVWYNPRPSGWRLPTRIDAPADLRGAVLPGVDLVGARLRDADLTGADLRGTDLTGADLRDAILRRTRLDGARLAGADLRGARDLEPRQLDTACGDSRTQLPAGLRVAACAP